MPRLLCAALFLASLAGCLGMDCDYPPRIGFWSEPGAYDRVANASFEGYRRSFTPATAGLPLRVEAYGNLSRVERHVAPCGASECPTIVFTDGLIESKARNRDQWQLQEDFWILATRLLAVDQSTLRDWSWRFAYNHSFELPNGTPLRLADGWAEMAAPPVQQAQSGAIMVARSEWVWTFSPDFVTFTADTVTVKLNQADVVTMTAGGPRREDSMVMIEETAADLGLHVPANLKLRNGTKC